MSILRLVEVLVLQHHGHLHIDQHERHQQQELPALQQLRNGSSLQDVQNNSEVLTHMKLLMVNLRMCRIHLGVQQIC